MIMKKVNILFVLHNHQPCDNFGWVFDDAYTKAYEPFLSVLEKYPRVKICMHYSGSLFEWIYKNRPEFFDRLKKLVKTRQIELLTGGYHEPILSMIPDRDSTGQINMLSQFIKNHFEFIPHGLWLTERVWEDGMPDFLLKQGLDFTFIDENHLRKAGVNDEFIHGYYTLPNNFKVFPISKKLRYIIPFAKTQDIIEYCKSIAEKTENSFVVFADDGEKFGMWPHTSEWVYKKKWLEDFFEYLNREDACVRTVSAAEAVEIAKPKEITAIPKSSYSEMMEWSNGDFNNFFKIYPEANIMRNRMIYVSDMLAGQKRYPYSTSKQKLYLERARRELYKAQSGCAYWHGIFGGLYFNHLRSGVYRHLINAQSLIDEVSAGKQVYIKSADLDSDLHEEYILGNKFMNIYVKPDNKGTVFQLDNKAKSQNMINTIARRREPYHDKLLSGKKIRYHEVRRSIANDKYINIHDVLGIKGRHLKKYLVYDDGEKSSFVDYIVSGKMRLNDFASGNTGQMIKVSKYPYRILKKETKDAISLIMEKEEDFLINGIYHTIWIRKEMTVSTKPEFTFQYTIKNISRDMLRTSFATEFNWSLMNKVYMKSRCLKKARVFSLKDEWNGASVKYMFNQDVEIWTTPVFTLNETEAGLDSSYQCLSLLVQKPLCLKPGEETKVGSTVLLG